MKREKKFRMTARLFDQHGNSTLVTVPVFYTTIPEIPRIAILKDAMFVLTSTEPVTYHWASAGHAKRVRNGRV